VKSLPRHHGDRLKVNELFSPLSSLGLFCPLQAALNQFATAIATGRATIGQDDVRRSGVANIQNAKEMGQGITMADWQG
jgi:hypothetical protein